MSESKASVPHFELCIMERRGFLTLTRSVEPSQPFSPERTQCQSSRDGPYRGGGLMRLLPRPGSMACWKNPAILVPAGLGAPVWANNEERCHPPCLMHPRMLRLDEPTLSIRELDFSLFLPVPSPLSEKVICMLVLYMSLRHNSIPPENDYICHYAFMNYICNYALALIFLCSWLSLLIAKPFLPSA